MNVTREAGSAVGETSMCRKVRSSDEPAIETSAQEMSYRLKLYPDVSKVLKEKIRCTACATPLLKEVMTGRSLYFHPILQVLFCKDCRGFYGDGEFPLDEDNSDTYCRWCAQGGNLYCCSCCNFVFCKPCIRRNFRHSMLEEIEEEDWNCFVCNPEALWKQRAICWAAREFSKSHPQVSSKSESSDEDSIKMRKERSWRNNSKRRGKKNACDDDKQKKRKRRSKRYEISDSGDSGQERTEGKKKAGKEKEDDEERKDVKEKKDKEEREDDDERKAEDKSSSELRNIRLSKIRKNIEDDLSGSSSIFRIRKNIEDDLDLEAEPSKVAMMKKTCLSMEKLTKSAQHVTNAGARKMHELHAWISGKNASPRKQQQLSPTKLKKMMASFSKIIHGLKENAEELERRVHAVEEEWVTVFEEGSKEMENGEGGEVENEDLEKNGEEENVPENVNDSILTVNGLDMSSNVGNISLDETIPLDKNEHQLEVKDTKDISDAETVVIDCNADIVTEENDKVEEEDKENHREDNAEREQAQEAEKRKEETEVGESSKITDGSISDQNNVSSRLNVSLDIFGDEENPPASSSIVPSESEEEKAESVAPVICEDLESEKENITKDDGKNEEKHNLCEKSLAEEDVGDVIMTDMDGNTDIGDDDEKEASKDSIKKKADEVEHSSQENKENVKPSKDDRDAKLEFLLDSSSSEESDNKVVDGVRKGRGKVKIVADSDSTDSSDSDSEAARKIKKDRKKDKDSKVPSGKLILTELVAQFDDEKLKKGCSVVVEKLEKADVIDDVIGKKSAKDLGKEEDEMDKAIKRLANLTSLEKPRKNKKSSSNSDSGSDGKKTKRSALKKENKKNGLDKKSESPEEDQSDEAPHVSTDELEMELKTVSKTDDSKMDEVAKNILVEDSSDSDSDFFLNSDEKKERLKRRKAEKPENRKTEKKDSDSDFETKNSKQSWRNNRLLTAKLSETDSSEEERRFKKKKKRLESDSDEEVESKVKSRNRRRLRSSSSDEIITSGGSNSESDSGKGGKKKRKRGLKSDSSGSSSLGSQTKKKKKHRRIKLAASDSDSDEKKKEDSDIEEIDDKGSKGRKNIRKVIKDKMLGEGAKQAAKDEDERKRRIAERQKLYNEFFVNKEKEAAVEKLVLDFDPDSKEELVAVHPDLVKKLTPHQAEGVKFMWDACFESLKRMETEKGSGCILAHCMGLGKTLQVVALVHTLLHNPKINIKTILVICPLNTVLNWVNEFEIWLKDLDNDIEIFELTRYKANVERMYQLKDWQSSGGVMILGYDMYRVLLNGKNRRKKVQETFVSTLADPGPDMVICDEGHLLKNLQSALSKAVNSIKTERRIVLTGTPLQNNLKEYHCMIQFVKPNLLGTHKEFLNRFVNPISNGQCADSTPHDVKIMKRRAHVLHKMLDGCVQRRDFSVMIPYLPPKHEYVVLICLTELQSKLYSHYIQTFSQRGTGGGASLFNDFQNLQRIWTHPRVLKMSTEKQELRKMMQSDSEGSLKDFICDDTDESDTTETSSESSNDDKKRKRKKLKRNCKTEDSSSSDSSDVICVDSENKEKEGKEEDNEKEDPVPLGQKAWWESFIQPEDHDKIIHSGKLMLLMTILKKCEMIGDKILLFSQSLYSLDLIEYFLEYIDSSTTNSQRLDQSTEGDEGSSFSFTGSWEKGIDYFRIDGSVSGENRSMWCKSFNREDNLRARLFLISTRAGGIGINLVGANRVILFDASWNPSNDVQSIYRVYRFGQKKPCYVYRFLAQGTMEEKIYNRQVTKLSLASRVLDEHQIERHYNFDDLQELYSYEPTDMSKRPTPILPKDRLLAELIQSYPNVIYNHHEHDSLLQNIAEEELTEEERKAAWEDFENEKIPKIPDNLPMGFGGVVNSNLFSGIPYPTISNAIPGLMEALMKKYPNATQEQLSNELRLVNSQLTHYFPDHQQQLYNQMLPENMMQQNFSLFPEMRQRFQQSAMMDQLSYQNYVTSPYFTPPSNSSHSTARPTKVQNNPQQYASNANSIPPVQFPPRTGAAKPLLLNKDSVMKAPSVSEKIEPKIKIRSDLLASSNDDDVIIESVQRRE